MDGISIMGGGTLGAGWWLGWLFFWFFLGLRRLCETMASCSEVLDCWGIRI